MIVIVNDTLGVESMWGLRQDLKAACAAVREEFEEHLDAINSNTREVAAAYDVLSELDYRLDKLAERLDRLEMVLRPEAAKPSFLPLTHREQEVFCVLYASDDSLSAAEIGRRLGLGEEMVATHLANLTAKGVPILRRLDGGSHYLESSFKALQARENVLRIDERLVGGLVAERAV